MRKLKNTEIVQLTLLQKKVNEYFSKNPRAKSVVFETNTGVHDFRCKVENQKGRLQILEMNLLEAPVGQVRDQEAQAQQAAMAQQQQALQPGPPMMPVSAAPLPPQAMPVMQMAPQQPVMVDPNQQQVPVDPAAMAPQPTPVQQPPVQPEPQQGPVNWDEIVASIEAAKAADPDGFTQRFGATPQQQLQNPNVPPEVVTQTEPPDQRGGQKIQSSAQPMSEASADYANITQQFMSSMDDLDSSKAAQLVQIIHQSMPKLRDPVEIKGAHNMLNMINSYRGKLDNPSVRQAVSTMTSGPSVHFGESKKKRKGLLFEQDDEMADDMSMEDAPFVPGTAEEAALVDSLKGQTVKDVKLVNNATAIGLELNLATTDWPAIFEFTKGGKLTFIFKDRRYVLHKKWN